MQKDPQKHLIYALLEYLNSPSVNTPAIAENIEVASQCLSQAFNVDTANADQKQLYSLHGQDLPALLQLGLKAKAENWGPQPNATATPAAPEVSEAGFHRFIESLTAKNYFKDAPVGSDEYNTRLQRAREKYFSRNKTQEASDSPAKAATGPPTSPSAASVKSHPYDLPALEPLATLSAEARAARVHAAEQFKTEGNQKVSDKQYKEAVEAYSKAIQQNNTVAVYFANRAAALSFLNEHQLAIQDCQRATELDPTYPKAYSRWGHACFSLGQYREAVEQYKRAVALDPGNVNCVDALAKAEERLRATSGGAASAVAPSSSPFGARSTPAPAAGMPPLPDLSQVPELSNLAGVFNNPQFMNMAQQMMQNPAFVEMANNMMQNPDSLNGLMQNVLGGRGPGGPGGSAPGKQ